jgi:hypothetical protein
MLTRAKLHAPASLKYALAQIDFADSFLKQHADVRGDLIPSWVRSFFNERTLYETITLMTELIRRRLYFGAGCLLGLLHHQRPGFLSYPASHLAPYLRDNLYPREQFPEAYEYRDPLIRLRQRFEHILSSTALHRSSTFKVAQASILAKYVPDQSIDTIISSPPYMNAVDYSRDNRLRLWFLGVDDFRSVRDKEIRKISTFEEDMLVALSRMSRALKKDGNCVLVLGDLMRSSRNYDVPGMINNLVKQQVRTMALEREWNETVPNNRKTNRNGRATKTETILIFRRLLKEG